MSGEHEVCEYCGDDICGGECRDTPDRIHINGHGTYLLVPEHLDRDEAVVIAKKTPAAPERRRRFGADRGQSPHRRAAADHRLLHRVLQGRRRSRRPGRARRGDTSAAGRVVRTLAICTATAKHRQGRRMALPLHERWRVRRSSVSRRWLVREAFRQALVSTHPQ